MPTGITIDASTGEITVSATAAAQTEVVYTVSVEVEGFSGTKETEIAITVNALLPTNIALASAGIMTLTDTATAYYSYKDHLGSINDGIRGAPITESGSYDPTIGSNTLTFITDGSDYEGSTVSLFFDHMESLTRALDSIVANSITVELYKDGTDTGYVSGSFTKTDVDSNGMMAFDINGQVFDEVRVVGTSGSPDFSEVEITAIPAS